MLRLRSGRGHDHGNGAVCLACGDGHQHAGPVEFVGLQPVSRKFADSFHIIDFKTAQKLFGAFYGNGAMRIGILRPVARDGHAFKGHTQNLAGIRCGAGRFVVSAAQEHRKAKRQKEKPADQLEYFHDSSFSERFGEYSGERGYMFSGARQVGSIFFYTILTGQKKKEIPISLKK